MALFKKKSIEEEEAELDAQLEEEESRNQQHEEQESKLQEIAEKRARLKALKVARFKNTGLGKVGSKVESMVKKVGHMAMQQPTGQPKQAPKNPMNMFFGEQSTPKPATRPNWMGEEQSRPRKMGGWDSGASAAPVRRFGGFDAGVKIKTKKGREPIMW